MNCPKHGCERKQMYRADGTKNGWHCPECQLEEIGEEVRLLEAKAKAKARHLPEDTDSSGEVGVSCRNCRWLKSVVHPNNGKHDMIEHTIHACRHPRHRTILGVDWSNRAPVDVGFCADHGPQLKLGQ